MIRSCFLEPKGSTTGPYKSSVFAVNIKQLIKIVLSRACKAGVKLAKSIIEICTQEAGLTRLEHLVTLAPAVVNA